MKDLITVVDQSFCNQTGGWDCHLLNNFLTTAHDVK